MVFLHRTQRMATAFNLWLCLLLLLTGTSCRNLSENADEAWRWLDPVGHRRFHREKYYPNERRMGLRMPEPKED